ncbi:SET domain-containing protein [Xylaria sp. CBS 124048]|nr:SET domain-containing protein [Xylaria sp. CBS 124048]
MRLCELYTLFLGSSICLAAGNGVPSPPEPLRPEICPWTPAIQLATQKPRPRACASPDHIRKLVLSNPPPSSPSSWVGPEHCVNGTCVFSNAAQNGGISLITSPLYAQIIQSYPFTADSGAYPQPFHTQEIAGKGVGVRANRSIAKGEVLMVRGPTLVAERGALVGMGDTVLDRMYDIAMARLTEDRRAAFIAQMGRGVSGKVSTNSFLMFVNGAGEEGSGHLACYPDIAQINHDCRPNVHYRLNNMTMTAVAVRDIQPGEELTVSYVDVFLPSKARKERIRNWGFECACSLCQATKEETIASDERLRRIRQLASDLSNFKNVTRTGDMGAEYVALHEEEGLSAQLGSAYTRAALNFALFGDEEQTRIYALKAAEQLSIEKGPESEDAHTMRNLAADPRTHWSWGKRKKVGE